MATTKFKGKVAVVHIKGANGGPDTVMVEVALDDQELTIVDNPDQNVRISDTIRTAAKALIDAVVAEAPKT